MTSNTNQDSDTASLEGIQGLSQLSEGEIYSGTVDRHNGNAIISLPQAHLNLGRIDESVIGEEIRFEYIEGVWAKCLDEKYTYTNYRPKDAERGSSPESYGRGSKQSKSSGEKEVSKKAKVTKKEENKGTITSSDPDNKNKLLK